MGGDRFPTVWLAVAALTPGLSGCGGSGGDASGGADASRTTGREYHVALQGADTNPGTSARPWRTIQHAADTVGAGDVVYVHAGHYAEEVVLTHSGEAGAPLVLRHAPGDRPRVRRFELGRGASHVVLAGFEVTGYANWGVTLLGDNADVRLARLNISGGEAGIHFTVGQSGGLPEQGAVSQVVVEDCTVRDALYTGIDATPGPLVDATFRRVQVTGCGLAGEDSYGADGIGIEKGGRLTIEDCYIHDNGGDGIDLNSRDRSGWAREIAVVRNVVARNHLQGIKLWAGGRMQRNAVWGQGICPIMVGAYDCAVQMLGNTVAYNMWSPDFGARDYAATVGHPEPGSRPARVRLIMRNNVWALNTGPAVGSPTGLYLGPRVELVSEGRNVFYSRSDGEIQADFLGGQWFSRAQIRAGEWAAATGQGQDDLCANPRFVSGWPAVDLHLSPGSPVAGRGAYP